MADGRTEIGRTTSREHALDAARGLLMILGVPYHAGLIYTPDYHWLIDSPDKIPGMDLFALFIHSFRMPAFFLISGMLVAKSLASRGPKAVLATRAARLLVPLVVVWSTVNVFQFWLAMRAGDPDLGTAEILGALLPTAIRRGELTFHLWFLVDLFVCVAALCAVWPLLGPLRRRLTAGAPRLARLLVPETPWLPPVMIVAMLLGTMGFDNLSPLLVTRLVPSSSTVASIAVSGSFFITGVFIAQAEGGARRFARAGFGIAAAYLACYLIQVAVDIPDKPIPLRIVEQIAYGVGAWMGFRLLLGVMLSVFERESRGVRALQQASYTIYLLHHPVAVMAGFAFLFVSLCPALEFTAVCVIGLVIPLAVHRIAVQRSPLLRFLLNGVPPRDSARHRPDTRRPASGRDAAVSRRPS